MPEKYQSLAELLNLWFGGAATTVIGALIGRVMWHANEVRKSHRRFFGKELLWQFPIAIGMAFIGDGLASWLRQPAHQHRARCGSRLPRAARNRGAV